MASSLDSVIHEAAVERTRSLGARLGCTAIAAAAFYCVLNGLQHLDVLHARVAARIARSSLVATAEPPLVFFAVCILLLLAIAMLLAWYTAPGKAAARLSFFVVLVAFGYATIFNGEALIALYFSTGDWTLAREIGASWKRVVMRLELVLLSLYLFPAWTLAGAILLRFLTEFPSRFVDARAALPLSDANLMAERAAILAVVVLASILYVATLPLGTPAPWLWVCALAALGALLWLGIRHRSLLALPNKSGAQAGVLAASRRAMIVAILALVGTGILSLGGTEHIPERSRELQMIVTMIAGVCLLVSLPRALASTPWSAYLPVTIMIGGYLILRQLEVRAPDLETDGELSVYPWLIVCSVLAVRLALARLSSLDDRSRQQALILLAGIALASVFALSWAGLSSIYLLECGAPAAGVFCALAKYKDWLHELPGLALAIFFALALRFPGEVDASRLFRRTTLYAALGASIVFGFAVLEHLIEAFFGHLLSDETPRTIAAGVVGMAVHPAKQRLEEGINMLLRRLLSLS